MKKVLTILICSIFLLPSMVLADWTVPSDEGEYTLAIQPNPFTRLKESDIESALSNKIGRKASVDKFPNTDAGFVHMEDAVWPPASNAWDWEPPPVDPGVWTWMGVGCHTEACPRQVDCGEWWAFETHFLSSMSVIVDFKVTAPTGIAYDVTYFPESDYIKGYVYDLEDVDGAIITMTLTKRNIYNDDLPWLFCTWTTRVICEEEDECEEATLVIVCDSDSVQLGHGSACDTLDRNVCIDLRIGGWGQDYGPYDWTISGTGFYFDHGGGVTGYTTTTPTSEATVSVCASGTACGSGTITITDTCENTGTGYVRCTTGQWVALQEICSYPGASDGYLGAGIFYRNIGKYRQTSGYSYVSFVNFGGCQTPETACASCGGCTDNTECVEMDCVAVAGANHTKYKVGDWCLACGRDGDCPVDKERNWKFYEPISHWLYEWQCP